MDLLLNPVLAPFSKDRAAKTTVPKVAITWGILGFAAAVLFTKN